MAANGNGAAAPPSAIRAMRTWFMGRMAWAQKLGITHEGARNVYTTLGYKRQLEYDDYLGLYRRGGIAKRIVDMPPKSTWQHLPTLREDKDPESETDLELEWRTLTERLRVYKAFQRADRLAGIGRYAILFIGVRGVPTTAPMPQLNGSDDLIYLTAFSERAARVDKWVGDPSDPRFGMPEIYEVTPDQDLPPDVKLDRRDGGAKLHWTRVIHVAEDALENDVFGTPRLEAVYNLFDDLMKVVGGSAEMFWKGAAPRWNFNMDADTEMSDEEVASLQDEVAEWEQEMRSWLRTRGIDVKQLGGQVADPRGHASVILDLISGATGIPQRVLLGSERGELASQQDERNWLRWLTQRQRDFAEPVMIRPFVDRLIEFGGLPEPSSPYLLEWKDLLALGEREAAEVLRMRTRAARDLKDVVGKPFVGLGEGREFLGLPMKPSEELVDEPEPQPEPVRREPAAPAPEPVE